MPEGISLACGAPQTCQLGWRGSPSLAASTWRCRSSSASGIGGHENPFVGDGARAYPDAIASPGRRQEGGEMPFEVPPLPYDYAALEPHIDEQTMRLHHDKHHQAYVDKANAALQGTGEEDRPVEHILTILDELPEDKRTAIRNNAGGHANHSLFWEIMSPDGGGAPTGSLAEAIDDTFGGFDELKKQINDAG